MRILLLTICLLSSGLYHLTQAQKIRPGFDTEEYIELLKVSAKCFDREATQNIPFPDSYSLCYRSPEMGLDNAWELWTSEDSIAVINIRPTINSGISWISNIYCFMVPATGSIGISEDKTFDYCLATHPRASVHIGWLISMAYLSEDILPKIDSCYNDEGIKDFYIVGHSQGGAVSYLLTSYLHQMKKNGQLPADMNFKTYCSASPKPGNQYYAYDYEHNIKDGWAYNVVNADDWVPEMPFTIQTTDDFVEVNPFHMANNYMQQQNFFKRMLMKLGYNNLDKPTKKTVRKYHKFLGKRIEKPVKSYLTGLDSAEHNGSFHFVRAGNTVVLMGDEDYYALFPMDKEELMMHHRPDAYLYLAQKMNEENKTSSAKSEM